MPAAAVIPAPIAYIKVVAVKKLVVGLWWLDEWSLQEWMYFFVYYFLRGRQRTAINFVVRPDPLLLL